ncbi:MAG: FAD-binding oxidoreductase [Pseudomonadota bacterium]
MSLAQSQTTSLLQELASILGDENVLTDAHSVTLYAQDVHTKSRPAMAVIRPATTEELSAAVRATTAAGHAIIARGGGMSYTSGYVPSEDDSVIVDMRRMNRIVAVNAEDMYVTVQCGCTWDELHQALDGTGLRTPYWGTLSGIRATVGGGLSQNSIFWGSARYGTAADSVIGLEVVLADGTVVKTGAHAQENSTPFFRHFGPDLTGLFTCDAGALGFKAEATLRLIPECQARRFVSFEFDDDSSMLRAMSDISRADVAAECFGFDPYLQNVRMQRESLVSDVKKLAGVVKASGSVLGAIKDSAKLAMAGRGYMKNVKFSLHVMLEEQSDAAADAGLARVRELCEARDGRELEDSIPKILRANPFTPLNNVVGPRGERWVPIHTIVPHSKAADTLQAVNAIFDTHREDVDRLGIGVGYLLAVVATNGFVIEPVFFTPDAMQELHRDTVEDAVLKTMPGFDENPEARALTEVLRTEIIAKFAELGGIHMQIGKTYPYRDHLRPEPWRIVEALKKALDPSGRVNPGSLGLH